MLQYVIERGVNIMLKNFKIYREYLKYVLEHKKNVAKICKRRGLKLHAITHDMSKLSLSEFRPYAQYYYGDKEKYREEFEKAWTHHYKSNPHHWEHWVDENNIPCDIPVYDIACMIADWEAMSVKFGDTPQAYYMQNHYKFNITKQTRAWIEYMLGINLSMATGSVNTLEDMFTSCYECGYSFPHAKDNQWLYDKYGVDLLSIFNKHRRIDNEC